MSRIKEDGFDAILRIAIYLCHIFQAERSENVISTFPIIKF